MALAAAAAAWTSCSSSTLSWSSLRRSTCRAVRGKPSTSTPAGSASGSKTVSSSASATSSSGTSSPAAIAAAMRASDWSRLDIVTARVSPRDSRMKTVLVPLPLPGAPMR